MPDRPTPDAPTSAPDRSPLPYTAPAITPLGTLADLTLGGIDGGSDDGWGGAGDNGGTGSI